MKEQAVCQLRAAPQHFAPALGLRGLRANGRLSIRATHGGANVGIIDSGTLRNCRDRPEAAVVKGSRGCRDLPQALSREPTPFVVGAIISSAQHGGRVGPAP